MAQATQRTWIEMTGFQRDLLSTIRAVEQTERDQSGQEIKHEYETWSDNRVKHGRLYPNLDELAEKGLIKKGQLDRRTNSYETTEKGRAELNRAVTRLQTVTSTGVGAN